MNYIEFKEIRKKQDDKVDVLSKKLKSFPKQPNGMTVEHIRMSDEYKNLKREFNAEFSKSKEILKIGLKLFKKEMKADSLANRFKK